MATGRDVAEFVSKLTGEDYVGLYDMGEENEKLKVERARKLFRDITERINESSKNGLIDRIE